MGSLLQNTIFGKKNIDFFLDQVTEQSIYAFSLRKLSKYYNGNCIKVRRNLDNTEADIGFYNNKINIFQLLSFCGTSDGYVSVWYDQSGNERNKTQVIAANQPKIVDAGNIIVENGLPTLKFTTANNMIQTDTTSIDELCFFYVASIKEGSSNYYGIARHIPSSGYGFAIYCSYGTQFPSYVPYLNGNNYAFGLRLFNGPDALPTPLTVRSFSSVGSINLTDTYGHYNSEFWSTVPSEGNWGSYSVSGLNMGYFGASANMNLSEYIVFSNSVRDNLTNLSNNAVNYYHTEIK